MYLLDTNHCSLIFLKKLEELEKPKNKEGEE